MSTQPRLVNKQFNSPIGLYSEQNVKEVLEREQQILANGAIGIDFHNQSRGKPANLQNSAVLRMLEEEERRSGHAGNSDHYPRPLQDVTWPPPDYDHTNQLRSSFKDVVIPGAKRVAWPPPQEGVLDPAEVAQYQAAQPQGGPGQYSNQSPGLPAQHSYSPQQQPAAPYQQPAQQSYRPLKPLDVSSVGTGSPLASPAYNTQTTPQGFRSVTPAGPKSWAPVQSPTTPLTPGVQKYFGSPAPSLSSQGPLSPTGSQIGREPKVSEPGRQYFLRGQQPNQQAGQQYQQPGQQAGQPSQSAGQQYKPTGQQYQQPGQQYQQPGQQYQQPGQQYQQPGQQYQQPGQQYQQPGQQYQQPGQQYQQSGQQYQEAGKQYQQSGQLQYQQSTQQYQQKSDQFTQQQQYSSVQRQQYQSQSSVQSSSAQNQQSSSPYQQAVAQTQAAPAPVSRPQSAVKPVEPPPSTITLRPAAPVSQAPPPVYSAQPATATLKGGKHLRGDLKWPPENVRQRMQEESQLLQELAKGPAIRPLKKEKDYTPFFEAHALNSAYPGYKIPPGTQYFRPEY